MIKKKLNSLKMFLYEDVPQYGIGRILFAK